MALPRTRLSRLADPLRSLLGRKVEASLSTRFPHGNLFSLPLNAVQYERGRGPSFPRKDFRTETLRTEHHEAEVTIPVVLHTLQIFRTPVVNRINCLVANFI